MRVILVFGTSGCGKGSFLKGCRTDYKAVYCSELEAEWKKLSSKSWKSQLGKPIPERRKALEVAVGWFLDSAKRRKVNTAILGIHATNMAESMLSSPLPVSVLKQLNIDFCLTVHDDLYAVRRRLQREGFHINYQQLLLWRNAEHVIADLVATELVGTGGGRIDPPNFWLGVKHPKSSLRRLLFCPTCPKVYSAYSIAGILEVKDKDPQLYSKLIAETSVYRGNLYQHDLIVFDPATLDDRLLVKEAISNDIKGENFVTINQQERWPYVISDNGSNAPMVGDPKDAFPFKIAYAEASLLRGSSTSPHAPYSDIDAHVTQIDLRYVAQADFVTVWRPFNQGVPSVGCLTEVNTAHTLGKDVLAYSLETDLQQYAARPENKSRPLKTVWPAGVPLFTNEQDFWDKVNNTIKKIRDRRKDCRSAVERVD